MLIERAHFEIENYLQITVTIINNWIVQKQVPTHTKGAKIKRGDDRWKAHY